MMIFLLETSESLYSGHLIIADTFLRNRRLPPGGGSTVFIANMNYF